MNKDLIHLIYIFIICFIIVFGVQTTFKHAGKIDTLTHTSGIENYVNDNNLNLPFPNWAELPNNNKYITELMNKNITDFHNSIQLNYYYDSLYDCKYWSYVWSNWWKYHKDEYELKTIKTSNHIFIILSNDSSYCIADQNNLYCETLLN